MEAAPLLASASPREELPNLWARLLELADGHGVARASMIMCALFSASAAHSRMNPAMGVLKPRLQYTDKHAFNALSDLRSLDLMMSAITDFPENRVALLTEDRALALYWVGMQTHSHRRNGDNIQYSLRPHAAMFGRLTDHESKTALRMLTGN